MKINNQYLINLAGLFFQYLIYVAVHNLGLVFRVKNYSV